MDTTPTNSPQPEPSSPEQPSQSPTIQPPKKARMSKKKLGLAVVISAVAVVVVLLATIVAIRNSRQTPLDTSPDLSQPNQQDATAIDRLRNPQTGEQWFDDPQLIESLGLFQDDGDVLYRLAGKRDANEIIHTFRRLSDGSDRNHFLFERSPDGKLTAILRPQAYDLFTPTQRDDVQAQFSDKVTAYDTVTNYDSLSIPQSIDLSENERIDRIDSEGLGAFPVQSPAENTRKLLESYGASKLFVLNQFDEKYQLTHAKYQIETPLQTRITVRYFPQDTSLASYRWDNGKVPRVVDLNGLPITDSIVPFSSGCEAGGVRSTLLDKLDDADISSVGSTKDGSSVYQFVDSKHPLINFIYSKYREKNESQRQAVDSLTDFLNFHGVIILKNSDQQPYLYVRDGYLARYQCR